MAIREVKAPKKSVKTDYHHSKKEVNKMLINTKYLTARLKNFGWVEVEITSPRSKEKRKFNVRPRMVKEAQQESRESIYPATPEGVLYTKLIASNKKAKQYSDRRMVEGILKTARDTLRKTSRTSFSKGGITYTYQEFIKFLEDLLKSSDAEISKWYHNEWLAQMSNAELEYYYDPSDPYWTYETEFDIQE